MNCDLTDQLIPLGTRRIAVEVGGGEAGPYNDEADFRYRGILVGTCKMDTYCIRARPATTIAIEIKGPDWLGPSDPIAPERALAAIRNVPDVRLIGEIRFLGGSFSYQAWLRQIAESELTIQAETGRNGEITIYNNGCADLESVILHEWCHLLAFRYPEIKARFDQVCKETEFNEVRFLRALLGHKWQSFHGAYPVLDEAWSWIGEKLLEGIVKSLDWVLSCPAQAVLFGEALTSCLATLPHELEGPRHEEYVRIGQWLAVTIKEASGR